ncbi:MAG: hypothetical protein AABN95_17005 [Acidobacteriota bacterium]
MKRPLPGVCLCILIAVCSLSLKAQEPVRTPNPWLVKAEAITDDLVGDAAKLDRFDRSLLLGRLGQLWWDIDQERAREWMQKAISSVEATSSQDEDQDRSQRLATARALLAIISTRDKQLSLKLTSLFIPKSSVSTKAGKIEDANALIDAALAVLDLDPKRAAELGLASLRISPSYRLATLLWRMRPINSQLSDALFAEAISAARSTYDFNLLTALVSVAFKGPKPSDELRAKVLAVVAEALLRPTISSEDEFSSCQFSRIASNLSQHYDHLPPQQITLVRMKVNRCQTVLCSGEKKVDETFRGTQPKTVEDFLKAAEETTQPKKDDLLARAAYLTFEKKDYDQAISILDAISDSGRKAMNGTWESWRATFAGMGAAAHVKRGDRQAMERIVANTPSTLRAFVRIFVVDAMATQDDRDGIVEFLYQARKDLANANETDKADWHINLVHRYAKFVPTDAPRVLSEAIASINRVREYEPKIGDINEDARHKVLSNELLLKSYSLPIQLLETDYLGVRQSISFIEAPTVRTAVRLNFLRTSLEKYRSTRNAGTLTTESGG